MDQWEISDESVEEHNVEESATTSAEPSIAAAASTGKGKGKEKKKNMKKKKEVHDWFSYHGRMQLELYNSVSVLLIRPVFPYLMIYNIDGFNAPSMPVNLFPNKDFIILGSWNGLSSVYLTSGHACLFNPNTNQRGHMFPAEANSLLKNANLFGLCYDSIEYKGLICDIESLHGPEMVVLRFRNGSCEYKKQYRFPKLKSRTNIGMVVNGVPYWVCENHLECSILKFDSKTEKLKIVPQLPNRLQVSQLGTLDGHLTATVYDNDEIQIWTLTEFSNGRCVSWALMFVLPPERSWISTLSWLIRDVELLLLTSCGKLFVYNVREKKQHLLSLDVQRMTYNMSIAYTPSSIDPKLCSHQITTRAQDGGCNGKGEGEVYIPCTRRSNNI